MASGYDFSSKNSYRLMQGRLGIYDKYNFDKDKIDPELDNIIHQANRLEQLGGNNQQERMIKDRRRSLDRAIWYSYQAAQIKKLESSYEQPIRALINPNKLKQDYDDKIVSAGFEYNLKCGDIIEWIGTKTYWLIYLQDLTELAYFRGDIRRCSYQISWNDESGEQKTTYAAIRGPVETKINYIQKHNISVDVPNHSLHILLPNNNDTLKYFQRYSKFYLQDIKTEKLNICWRVEALDWVSTPGILEINAVEYYANKDEDDIDNGIVGGLIIEPENPNSNFIEENIVGESFIKPKKEYEYYYNGKENSIEWKIDKKYPIILNKNQADPNKITLKWDSPYSGSFELYCGSLKKTIVVESLF